MILWRIETFTRERERERERVNRPRHIYHTIISTENLFASWQEFLQGKRKREDVAEFSTKLFDNIFALRQELVLKMYRHGGYQAFRIYDPKPREIHKASVRDRLLHHAICRVLCPIFDELFVYDSYSCRLGKGTHAAVNRFREYARDVSYNHSRTAWVLKCDIKQFFASINHAVLQKILTKHIQDYDVLWLLGEVIGSFHSEGGRCVGLPLGNLTSQLFANVYLKEFDQFVKHTLKAKYYIRYADDFVTLSRDKQYLTEMLRYIVTFLRDRLRLILHPDKILIKTPASGVDFLGWVHFPNYRVLRTSTKKMMFLTLENNHEEKTVDSYLGMLSHGNTCRLREKIKNEFVNEFVKK